MTSELAAWRAGVARHVGYSLAVAAVTLVIILMLLQATALRPLKSLIRSTCELSDGKLNTQISGDSRNDEFGDFARILVEFQSVLREKAGLQAAAEDANRSKSVFLANMSHEIRTPLNGIISVADILARSGLSPRERDLVGVIRASGETLARLLSDILDVARIESGEIQIETAPFHLGDMARSTCELFRMHGDEKGLSLRLLIAPEVDREHLGDLVRTRQVLSNLLSNAIKFTAQGEINVVIEPVGDLVRITVRDQGIGFDASARDRVFGRFQQTDESVTRKYGGTGLGLAISRDLAELMGGRLDCASEPGVGSTFWMDLPLAAASGAGPGRLEPVVSEPNGRMLRILSADDHPTNRMVVELMLAGVAEVVSVEDGQEALSASNASEFDLILMDMQMPVMDGLTSVREIRRSATPNAGAPIIILTANAMPKHIEEAHRAGANLHLTKPITSAVLIAAIDQVLKDAVSTGVASGPEAYGSRASAA